MAVCLLVRPGDEAFEAAAERCRLERAAKATVVVVVVAGCVEQQFAVGDHAFQYSDGAHNGGDGDPGDCSLRPGGDVAAFIIGDVFEVAAADEVAPGRAVGVRLGIGTVSRAQ